MNKMAEFSGGRDFSQTRANSSFQLEHSNVALDEVSGQFMSLGLLALTGIFSSIVVCTIVGNLFVILAILVDKNLQTAANQLVLSLAVADLMVACLVMPLGAYNDIQQGWYLSRLTCEFWTSADVLCCTASILNLLAIAIDRYWAVTNVDYIYKRTRQRVGLMILCAWTVAAIVSLAPIFGWKDPDFAQRVLIEHKCLVSQDVSYQIFATISTFYAPLVLLLALYWRIFQVARKRIRRKPGDRGGSQPTEHTESAPKRANGEAKSEVRQKQLVATVSSLLVSRHNSDKSQLEQQVRDQKPMQLDVTADAAAINVTSCAFNPLNFIEKITNIVDSHEDPHGGQFDRKLGNSSGSPGSTRNSRSLVSSSESLSASLNLSSRSKFSMSSGGVEMQISELAHLKVGQTAAASGLAERANWLEVGRRGGELLVTRQSGFPVSQTKANSSDKQQLDHSKTRAATKGKRTKLLNGLGLQLKANDEELVEAVGGAALEAPFGTRGAVQGSSDGERPASAKGIKEGVSENLHNVSRGCEETEVGTEIGLAALLAAASSKGEADDQCKWQCYCCCGTVSREENHCYNYSQPCNCDDPAGETRTENFCCYCDGFHSVAPETRKASCSHDKLQSFGKQLAAAASGEEPQLELEPSSLVPRLGGGQDETGEVKLVLGAWLKGRQSGTSFREHKGPANAGLNFANKPNEATVRRLSEENGQEINDYKRDAFGSSRSNRESDYQDPNEAERRVCKRDDYDKHGANSASILGAKQPLELAAGSLLRNEFSGGTVERRLQPLCLWCKKLNRSAGKAELTEEACPSDQKCSLELPDSPSGSWQSEEAPESLSAAFPPPISMLKQRLKPVESAIEASACRESKDIVDSNRPENDILASVEQIQSQAQRRPLRLDLRRKFRVLGQLVSFVQTSRNFQSSSNSASSAASSHANLELSEEQAVAKRSTLPHTDAQHPASEASCEPRLSNVTRSPVQTKQVEHTSGKSDKNSELAASSLQSGTGSRSFGGGLSNSTERAAATGASSSATCNTTGIAAGGSSSLKTIRSVKLSGRTGSRSNADIKREKKAAKTLAIITGVFVCCWLPFFVNAILMPVCGLACTPSNLILSILLWLGYLNSLLNPIIYTIFSPDFRRAFSRLLCNSMALSRPKCLC